MYFIYKTVACICGIVTLTCSHVAIANAQLSEFGIYRNDKQVGTHRVTRKVESGATTVEVSSRIRVTLFGLELYSFKYDATERWDADGLFSIAASVNDDGEQMSLSGERKGDDFSWQANGAWQTHPMPVYPTNHWNASVLEQDRVLNTLTGNINAVEIVPLGPRSIPGANTANVYRYDGELRLSSWYSDTGRWLGMRFETERGDIIEYRCTNCNQQAMK